MELHSTFQGQKCPCGKGKISDDICVGCHHFEGYVNKKESHGLLLKFTYNKDIAYNVDGFYFYICSGE